MTKWLIVIMYSTCKCIIVRLKKYPQDKSTAALKDTIFILYLQDIFEPSSYVCTRYV